MLVGVETSADLQTGTPLAVTPVLSPADTPGHEHVEFPLPAPATPAIPPSDTHSFYRLRFTLP